MSHQGQSTVAAGGVIVDPFDKHQATA